uniref:Uncharacterized protein n=1 Tax=Candidatus Kentrum sp. MB TaxID=2138164 RepID=A0A450XF94_9GAMM|nr:MAG: hypothetical protein BECKMB1821I_GA0114274_100552 [Candidatus Kentron sp. MB]VFK74487.1 MAG: hypothetical protein BECKMB1821H_GA0114242_100552 [Candidatus Kentron sp. MB]
MKSILGVINIFFGFIAGLLGGAAVMLFSHPIVKIINGDNPLLGAKDIPDVIAIANTYIVFTTFIFVLLTIAITGAGIWFARWFGISKDREIRDNMYELSTKLHSDSDLAEKFIKELFSHEEISNKIALIAKDFIDFELNINKTDVSKAEPFFDELTEKRQANNE